MHTLNRTLEEKILEADGRYMDAQALRSFEQYAHSYAARLETYQNLASKSHAIIVQSLRKLAQSHPDLVQKHGQRCQYDMTEVVRYIALSILRDDEIFFKEQMLSWLDTILIAHKKHDHCATAYRYLLDEINANLPPSNSTLLRPYLDTVITTLQSHA
ncbi:phycobilisome protein [Egbenema bharatensis]|uniref:phycobilisome protein n=1 Tax=Egbenema bharatensis TaxID=3463334 RepID=UPI003A88A0FA